MRVLLIKFDRIIVLDNETKFIRFNGVGLLDL